MYQPDILPDEPRSRWKKVFDKIGGDAVGATRELALAAQENPRAHALAGKRVAAGVHRGEAPTFAGVNLGKVQVFLAKRSPTPSSETGAVYFLVGDADQLYEFHLANGV